MIPHDDDANTTRHHWGGLATSLFGILIAILFLIVQILVLYIFATIKFDPHQISNIDSIEGLSESGFVLSIGSVATTLVCIPLIFLVIRIKKGLSIKEYLRLNFINIKTLLPWFAIITAFIICYDLVTHAIGRPIVPEFMIAAYKTATFLPLLWVAVVVLAPVSEEIFFRGFLFQGFQSTFLKPAGAVLVTSFLWAIIHMQYDYYDIIYIFIIGLLLGIARIKTKSIFTAIYLHGFMNLVATVETAIAVS